MIVSSNAAAFLAGAALGATLGVLALLFVQGADDGRG